MSTFDTALADLMASCQELQDAAKLLMEQSQTLADENAKLWAMLKERDALIEMLAQEHDKED